MARIYITNCTLGFAVRNFRMGTKNEWVGGVTVNKTTCVFLVITVIFLIIYCIYLQIVYFTALVPYILLLILLIRGVTLDGAVNGLIFYLKPDFSRLADADVWLDGATQVIYSIGVGQGFMITLGSYNKFNTNSVR